MAEVRTYQLLYGKHVLSLTEPEGNTLEAGTDHDTITTDKDMEKLFPNRFKEVLPKSKSKPMMMVKSPPKATKAPPAAAPEDDKPESEEEPEEELDEELEEEEEVEDDREDVSDEFKIPKAFPDIRILKSEAGFQVLDGDEDLTASGLLSTKKAVNDLIKGLPQA